MQIDGEEVVHHLKSVLGSSIAQSSVNGAPLLSGNDAILELHCLNLAMIDLVCSRKGGGLS